MKQVIGAISHLSYAANFSVFGFHLFNTVIITAEPLNEPKCLEISTRSRPTNTRYEAFATKNSKHHETNGKEPQGTQGPMVDKIIRTPASPRQDDNNDDG